MPYRLMADAVVVFHLLIVAFVATGGLLVIKWRRIAWLHLPIVAWVVFAEGFQEICPLTYLENWLRERGSMSQYHGDFVSHYLMPVLYPEGLTPRIQITIAIVLAVINGALYLTAFARRSEQNQSPAAQ